MNDPKNIYITWSNPNFSQSISRNQSHWQSNQSIFNFTSQIQYYAYSRTIIIIVAIAISIQIIEDWKRQYYFPN